MSPYRGLFLVVIISLTSIVFADVLAQSSYKHQSGSNLHYSIDPQYKAVNHRYRRSSESDSTSTESSKSEIVAHDNDVVAKSLLTDVKNPTTVNSLLPEHELTDTNDKRVENRQIKDDHMMRPRSDLSYSDILLPGRYPAFKQDKMQHLPYFPSIRAKPAQQMTIASQRNQQDYNENNLQLYPNKLNSFSMGLDSPTQHYGQAPHQERFFTRMDSPNKPTSNVDDYRSKYRNTSPNPNMVSMLLPNMRNIWPVMHNAFTQVDEYPKDTNKPILMSEKKNMEDYWRAAHQEFKPSTRVNPSEEPTSNVDDDYHSKYRNTWVPNTEDIKKLMQNMRDRTREADSFNTHVIFLKPSYETVNMEDVRLAAYQELKPSIRVDPPEESTSYVDDYHSKYRNAWLYWQPPSSITDGPQTQPLYPDLQQDKVILFADIPTKNFEPLDKKTVEELLIDREENTGASRAAQQEFRPSIRINPPEKSTSDVDDYRRKYRDAWMFWPLFWPNPTKYNSQKKETATDDTPPPGLQPLDEKTVNIILYGHKYS